MNAKRIKNPEILWIEKKTRFKFSGSSSWNEYSLTQVAITEIRINKKIWTELIPVNCSFCALYYKLHWGGINVRNNIQGNRITKREYN